MIQPEKEFSSLSYYTLVWSEHLSDNVFHYIKLIDQPNKQDLVFGFDFGVIFFCNLVSEQVF